MKGTVEMSLMHCYVETHCHNDLVVDSLVQSKKRKDFDIAKSKGEHVKRKRCKAVDEKCAFSVDLCNPVFMRDNPRCWVG